MDFVHSVRSVHNVNNVNNVTNGSMMVQAWPGYPRCACGVCWMNRGGLFGAVCAVAPTLPLLAMSRSAPELVRGSPFSMEKTVPVLQGGGSGGA